MRRVQHAGQNAMTDPGEIARFHDRCSDLMRELLDALADAPDQPRAFPDIEDAMGWPRRRIASVLGGVHRLRTTEFGGRRPYRFLDERASASGRWEMWMDAGQARAVRAARGPARRTLVSSRPLKPNATTRRVPGVMGPQRLARAGTPAEVSVLAVMACILGVGCLVSGGFPDGRATRLRPS